MGIVACGIISKFNVNSYFRTFAHENIQEKWSFPLEILLKVGKGNNEDRDKAWFLLIFRTNCQYAVEKGIKTGRPNVDSFQSDNKYEEKRLQGGKIRGAAAFEEVAGRLVWKNILLGFFLNSFKHRKCLLIFLLE